MNFRGILLVLNMLATLSYAEESSDTTSQPTPQVEEKVVQPIISTPSKSSYEQVRVLSEQALQLIDNALRVGTDNKGGDLDKAVTDAADLLRAIRVKSQECESIIGRIRTLSDSITDRDKSAILQLIEQLKQAHRAVEQQVRDFSISTDSSKTKRSEALAMLSDLQNKVKSLQGEFQMKQANRALAEQEYISIKNALEGVRDQNSSLKAEAEDLKLNIQNNEALKDNAEKDISKIKTIITDIQKENKDLASERQKTYGEIGSLKQQVAGLNSQSIKLRDNLSKLSNQNAGLQSNVLALNQESANLNGNIKALQLMISGYNLDGLKANATVQQMKELSTQLNEKIKLLKQQYTTIDSQRKSQISEQNKLQAELTNIQQQIQVRREEEIDLNDKISNVTISAAETKEQTASIGGIVVNLKTERQAQDNKVGELKRNLELKKAEHKAALNELKLIAQRIKQLEQEQGDLGKKLKDLQNELTKTTQNRAKTKKSDINSKIAALGSISLKLEQIKRSVDTELTRAESIKSELQAKLQRVTDEEAEAQNLSVKLASGSEKK